MTSLLIDSSVLIKWFRSEGESEVAAARGLRAAHIAGELNAHMLDLAVYEVGNVLVRALRFSAEDTVGQLDDLLTILGPSVIMTPDWWRLAARLAQDHALTFYDASWAAAAKELGIPLISADRRLLAAGLAESPTDVATRLKLPPG